MYQQKMNLLMTEEIPNSRCKTEPGLLGTTLLPTTSEMLKTAESAPLVIIIVRSKDSSIVLPNKLDH